MSVSEEELEEIIDSAVKVIKHQISVLTTLMRSAAKPGEDLLNVAQARNLVEYVRAVNLIQKQLAVSSTEEDADLKQLTDAELEALVIKTARHIQNPKRDAPGDTGK